jgi:predicted Zn-dependent peptidase
MDVNVKKFVLNNGVKVIIIPLKTKLTYISASFLLGYNHENYKQREISHYYEHLLGRLTSEKYKDYKYIGSEIVKRGGATNAFVNNYELCVYINGFYKDLEFYIDILYNSINNFYIDPELAEKEKGAVIQEIRNIISKREYIFDLKMFRYLYPKYKYLFDYKKNIENVKKFNIKLVKNFVKKNIISNNLVITVTCPINKVAETAHNIKSRFKILNGIKKCKRCVIKYPVLEHKSNSFNVIYINNAVTRAATGRDKNVTIQMCMFKDIKYLSKEHVILHILEHILFNFNTGIFYNELRNKYGLIYNIGMYINIDLINSTASSYNIVTKCEEKNVHIVIGKIIGILQNYAITDKDIQGAKINNKVIFENKGFYDINSYNNDYKTYLLYNKPFMKNKDIYRLIDNIRPQEIRDFYDILRKHILSSCVLFYYSNRNLNNKIDVVLRNSLNANNYKLLYI